jgi:UDP-glucose 4-epimerase
MSVMVIGGNGFVGGHVIRELINMGEKPVCLDISGESPILADMQGRYDFVQANVMDLGALIRHMQHHGVDRVVALTSMVTFASQNDPVRAYQLNIGSTLNVLEAARILPIKRIIYASSLAVYGLTPPGQPVPETAPLNPVSLYGATKIFCENLGSAYIRDHGVSFAAVRFPGMWGPGQGLLMGGKSSIYGSGKFADIIEKPAKGEIALVPGLKDKYELLYIKDARKEVCQLLFADELGHYAYNAGCESFNSLQEIGAMVKKRLPDARIEFEQDVEFPEGFDFAMPPRHHLDISRVKAEVGYEPEFPPEKAVDDYLAYLGR